MIAFAGFLFIATLLLALVAAIFLIVARALLTESLESLTNARLLLDEAQAYAGDKDALVRVIERSAK